MLKVKVIATDVENLTDARYFAAMGVEAVCFDLSAISSEAYYAIKEWIEGVEVYVKGTEEAMDSDIRIIHDIASFQSDAAVVLESSYKLISLSNLPAGQIINEYAGWNEYDQNKHHEIIDFAKAKRHYLYIPWTQDLLDTMVQADRIFGIVVSGGEEEKTGYKSFLELDELFEIIEFE